MHFGEQVDDDRLLALYRPDEGIRTVLTADVYGQGEADTLLGRALDGLARDSYCLVGAVGHDFYEGERQGAKGFPRFTDPSLRGPVDYAGLFHDDVLPGHDFPRFDHRSFRPAGWVEAGYEKFERLRPIAERHGL